METEMEDKVKAYIISFAAYDSEPLHIVLSALIKEGLCESASCAIPAILELLQSKYIECYHHSGYSSDEYKRVNHLSEDALRDYIRQNEDEGFREYPTPEGGGEYYLKTTREGLQFADDNLIFGDSG
jgi:hypothetical protein